mmetsp:Transcript_13414/g.58613  ORF Transcript_13414/g.58613 Transcript_13414/m.58613 type:complete len:310 (+) Transcript_13414:1319-2248(+)
MPKGVPRTPAGCSSGRCSSTCRRSRGGVVTEPRSSVPSSRCPSTGPTRGVFCAAWTTSRCGAARRTGSWTLRTRTGPTGASCRIPPTRTRRRSRGSGVVDPVDGFNKRARQTVRKVRETGRERIGPRVRVRDGSATRTGRRRTTRCFARCSCTRRRLRRRSTGWSRVLCPGTPRGEASSRTRTSRTRATSAVARPWRGYTTSSRSAITCCGAPTRLCDGSGARAREPRGRLTVRTSRRRSTASPRPTLSRSAARRFRRRRATRTRTSPSRTSATSSSGSWTRRTRSCGGRRRSRMRWISPRSSAWIGTR